MTNDDGPDDNDEALVRATLEGRPQAFGLLYDRYAPLVRALCFDATGDLTQSQDLAQETFLRAYRKLAKLRRPEQFATWLIGISRHVCREWRRSTGRGRRNLARLTDLKRGESEAADSEIAAGNDEDDEMLQLRTAIAALPQREREALHLFYLQEQPADAAASALGLSRSGFYRSLERAKNRLRQSLGLGRSRGIVP